MASNEILKNFKIRLEDDEEKLLYEFNNDLLDKVVILGIYATNIKPDNEINNLYVVTTSQTVTHELDDVSYSSMTGQPFLENPITNIGGNIIPASRTVVPGEKTVFTIFPNVGYEIDSIIGDGILVNNTFITEKINGNTQIVVNFKLKEYTINTISNNGGSLQPKSATIPYGHFFDFYIDINKYYFLKRIVGGNGSLIDQQTYRVGPVTSNFDIHAQFKSIFESPNEYIVNVYQNSGGTVDPVSVWVEENKTTDFTITPDPLYEIQFVMGTAGSLNENVYTTGPITKNDLILVKFKPIIDIYYNVILNIEYDGQTSQEIKTVLHGTSTEFYLDNYASYTIQSISGCNGSLSGLTYTTDIITSDCQIDLILTD